MTLIPSRDYVAECGSSMMFRACTYVLYLAALALLVVTGITLVAGLVGHTVTACSYLEKSSLLLSRVVMGSIGVVFATRVVKRTPKARNVGKG